MYQNNLIFTIRLYGQPMDLNEPSGDSISFGATSLPSPYFAEYILHVLLFLIPARSSFRTESIFGRSRRFHHNPLNLDSDLDSLD